MQFPPSVILVEILETIPMSNWLLRMCRKLKSRGYTIALDDFVLDRSYLSLCPYDDFIKVNLSRVSVQDASSFMKISNFFRVKWLAEKVELKKWISVLVLQELYNLHARDGQKHLYEEIVTLSFN